MGASAGGSSHRDCRDRGRPEPLSRAPGPPACRARAAPLICQVLALPWFDSVYTGGYNRAMTETQSTCPMCGPVGTDTTTVDDVACWTCLNGLDPIAAAILDEFPAAERVSTGGGCYAIVIPLEDETHSLLITDGDAQTDFSAEGAGFYMVRVDDANPCLETDVEIAMSGDRVSEREALSLIWTAVLDGSEWMAQP